jgi:hypothetical protein
MKRLRKRLSRELEELSVLFYNTYHRVYPDVRGKNYYYEIRIRHTKSGDAKFIYVEKLDGFHLGIRSGIGYFKIGSKIPKPYPMKVMKNIIEDFKELLGNEKIKR